MNIVMTHQGHAYCFDRQENGIIVVVDVVVVVCHITTFFSDLKIIGCLDDEEQRIGRCWQVNRL
jgi:hypothetical protein